MKNKGGFKPWIGRLILGVMVLSLLTSGVGWNEPALAMGPKFDPPLLPGLDLGQIEDTLRCIGYLGQWRSCGLFWM